MIPNIDVPSDPVAVEASLEDNALLRRLLLTGARLESEQLAADDYLNHVVEKPWGHECRVYADALYDFWELFVSVGGRTSTHCHPRKQTALLVLAGRAKIHLLNRTHILGAGEHLHFRPGAFHATENIGASALHLVELETPRNKLDLVRSSDVYGRAGQGYERTNLMCDMTPLVDLAGMPGARIRRDGTGGRYSFSLHPGVHAVERDWSSVLYAIPLSARPAQAGAFAFLARADSLRATANTNQSYLLVERNSEQRSNAQ